MTNDEFIDKAVENAEKFLKTTMSNCSMRCFILDALESHRKKLKQTPEAET